MNAAASDLTSGQRFGNYRIERLLGRGGMGAVYAAEQIDDGRQVAVKVLTSGLGSAEDRERFIREGHTAASINHPNTVYVYRTEEIDGLPTITMELVDGGTLEEKVERAGPLSITEAISDTLQVIDGLDAAQRLGILHRDIKPANCFVGPRGEVKVGDFGLSRPVEQVEQSRLTQTGLFLGTPVFSSPEQLMGEQLDVRSDIYAVGATLYFLLTGKLPYDADNAVRLIAIVMSGTPTPISTYRTDIPPALDAVITKCLARKRDERFADYASLRAALEACQPVEMVPAPLVRRIAAGVVDSWLIGMLGSGLFSLFKPANINFAEFAQDPAVQLRQALASLPVELLWYGVLEGLTGWSLGKRLLGIRVMKSGGGVPGLARGAARGVLIALPGLAGAAISLSSGDVNTRSLIASAIYVLMLVALFVRARRHNGFLGEHDRLTGTRVVRRRASVARHRSSGAVGRAPETIADNTTSVGAYDVSGALASAPHVLVGEDRTLKRPVWIVRQPVGAPVNETQRQAIRAGAARWIGGRRTDTEAWDAYAATNGMPLVDRLAQPFEWRELHSWLSDVADELQARHEHGEEQRATISQVLIRDDGHAMVLPFPVGAASAGDDDSPSLLQAMARRIQRVNTGTMRTWPLSATTLLTELAANGASSSLSSVREQLQALGERLDPLTARRRGVLWASIAGPLIVFSLFTGFTAKLIMRADADVARMQPLLSFLRETARITSPADSIKDQRQLVATYLVTNFGDRIVAQRTVKDSTVGKASNGFVSIKEWALADSLVRAMPAPSAEDVARASRLVDSTWHGSPPGARNVNASLPLFFLVAFVGMAAVFSVLITLAARRGFVMRLLALELVNAKGQRAGRVRLVWRQALVWTPVVAVLITTAMLAAQTRTPKLYAAFGISLLVGAASLVTAWRTPSRSLVERLSGTTMVPE